MPFIRGRSAAAIAFSFILSLTFLPKAAHADFDSGLVAYEARDYVAAAAVFRPLAYDGDVRSQVMMGRLLRSGLLGALDFESAAAWFRLAANDDDPDANFNLGLMFFEREIATPDGATTPEARDAGAYDRFSRAARFGHVMAQLYLGHMIARGVGTERDAIEAFKWYQLAAWERSSLAATARDQIAADMTPEQIAEARLRARNWHPAQS